MSLDPPPYLNSLQNNIRARPLPWEGAVRAGSITDEQLKQIRSVDKVRKEQRKQTIESDLPGFTTLLVGSQDGRSILEHAAKRTDIIQYILVLAADMINDAPSLASELAKQPDPYKAIIPLLSQSSNPEDPIPLLSSSFLTSLVSTAIVTSSKSSPKNEEALNKLFTYLSTLVKTSDSGLQDIGVQQYSALLRTSHARALFWKQRKETVEPLIDILGTAAGAGKDTDSTLRIGTGSGSIRSAEISLGGGVGLQLLYHVLLVIWQLSFEADLTGDELEKDYEIIPLYTQLLRLSPKEKTTRLLLSTLNNLLSAKPSSLIPAATHARLPALLSNLRGRHLTDQDLIDDLTAVSDMLEEHMKTQTTFDEYAAEVHSGHLRWSPPHRNAVFWRDNARKVVEDKELMKKLTEIIGKSWDNDKKVLAIACNDVGNLVKEVPEKRVQLEKLGLKTRVMELMNEADENVRWEALHAVGEWLKYSFGD